MNFNPDPILKYSAANVVANGWIHIEDDEHTLYWVKEKISVYRHVFSNKLLNRLILYLEVQKRKSSKRIGKLKEISTALDLKVIKSILIPINCIVVVTSLRIR